MVTAKTRKPESFLGFLWYPLLANKEPAGDETARLPHPSLTGPFSAAYILGKSTHVSCLQRQTLLLQPCGRLVSPASASIRRSSSLASPLCSWLSLTTQCTRPANKRPMPPFLQPPPPRATCHTPPSLEPPIPADTAASPRLRWIPVALPHHNALLRSCLRSSESGWEPSCSRSTQPCPALRSTRLGPSRRRRRKAERRGRWVLRCKMHSSAIERLELAGRAPPVVWGACARCWHSKCHTVYGSTAVICYFLYPLSLCLRWTL